MSNPKNTQLFFIVKGGWQYFKYIFMSLLVIGVLSYSNYEISQKGEASTGLIIFEIVMIILALVLAFLPILKIELSENRFIMKRIFGISLFIKYDEIEKINFSYKKDTIINGQKLDEIIVILRKNKKAMTVSIPRNRIELTENSDFLKSISFLSKKFPTTIHINPIYKPYVNENIIDANVKWTDDPKDFWK